MFHYFPIPDDCIEDVDFGDNATEIDAMEWMHTHHMVSKLLTPGEKVAMTEKLKAAIKEENEKKKTESNKNFMEINLYQMIWTALQLEWIPNLQKTIVTLGQTIR